MGDTAFGQVLYGPCAPDSVLRDPGRDIGGVKIFTFKDFHIDQVGSLWKSENSICNSPVPLSPKSQLCYTVLPAAHS